MMMMMNYIFSPQTTREDGGNYPENNKLADTPERSC